MKDAIYTYKGIDYKTLEGYKPKQECNGCGSAGNSGFVPDTIYFKSIKFICCIHDDGYTRGESQEHEDNKFLINLIRFINSQPWYYPKFLARRRALKYYEAVNAFGSSSFKKGKV